MSFRRVSIEALIVSVFALTHLALSQATVTANQGTYIYVSEAAGSDSNPGTSAKPLRTVQAGLNKALSYSRSGLASTVEIEPGVYREAINIGGKTSAASMTVRAATPGTVYIDGANVLTDWHKISSTVYTYYWKDSVGGCPLPSGWITGMPPIALKNEMLFVNGNSLTQVMSASQLVPGTFFVNSSYDEIEVAPPTGTDMYTANVEASERRETLNVTDSRNLAFVGLVFEHAASCMNVSGANVYSSTNVLFNEVQANWNNWIGLGISTSSYVTVENSVESYNGGLGFMGAELKNGQFSNNEADYNNWRGEMVAFYDYAQGGFKFGRNRNITVNGQRSYNNQGEGLWFDTDNANVTVENSKLVGNATENLKLEANEGPFYISHNTSCTGGVGVILMDSAGVTLTGNHFYGNQNLQGNLALDQNGQIFLAGPPGGRKYTSFTSGATITTENTNIKFIGNTFVDTAHGQYLFNTYLSGYDWTDFLDSFHSSDNTWSDGPDAAAFRVPGGKIMTLSGWRGLTGEDGTSILAAVSEATACGVPAPGHPDFALLAYNGVNYIPSYSMYKGRLSIPLQVKSFSYGTVKLSVSGLPSGVSASFSPSTLVSGRSTLTLSASTAAKWRTVPLTVFAISGSRVHTITFWVAVRPS